MSSKPLDQLVATIAAAKEVLQSLPENTDSSNESQDSFERLLRFAIQGNQHEKVFFRSQAVFLL